MGVKYLEQELKKSQKLVIPDVRYYQEKNQILHKIQKSIAAKDKEQIQKASYQFNQLILRKIYKI